jgi:hypothetical protein
MRQIADRIAAATGAEAVVGRPSTAWSAWQLRRALPGVPEAVASLGRRADADCSAPADTPLFILSAGWRSGSTLLQRLVNSTERYFIWGEPYHRTDLVRRLAESLIPFATGWPPPEYVHAQTGDGDRHDGWIANLYPALPRLLDSHRALLRELLAPPPERAGREWGFKEVRLSADYAVYLHLLFPGARFVFLIRDPRTAYRSYRTRPAWFERWPGTQVRTPHAYGRLWRRLAESFLAHQRGLGALVLRYEDLVAGGEAVDRLERALGAEVDRSVLAQRVAGVERGGAPSRLELSILDRATRPVAARLGYA